MKLQTELILILLLVLGGCKSPANVQAEITATKKGNVYTFNFPTDKYLQEIDFERIKANIELPEYENINYCTFKIKYQRQRINDEFKIKMEKQEKCLT